MTLSFPQQNFLLNIFFSLTDRAREDLKQLKSRIEHISETLKTSKTTPTKEEGQFPQITALLLRL